MNASNQPLLDLPPVNNRSLSLASWFTIDFFSRLQVALEDHLPEIQLTSTYFGALCPSIFQKGWGSTWDLEMPNAAKHTLTLFVDEKNEDKILILMDSLIQTSAIYPQALNNLQKLKIDEISNFEQREKYYSTLLDLVLLKLRLLLS